MSDTILTPDQVQMAQDAEPAEILIAIHKRIVDTEKLMMGYSCLLYTSPSPRDS